MPSLPDHRFPIIHLHIVYGSALTDGTLWGDRATDDQWQMD